jgi:hypothetical protein
MSIIIFCDKCLGVLEVKRKGASEVYENLCESYICKRNNLKLIENFQKHGKIIEMIRFLETESYVVTTEKGKFCVMVKPLGHAILKRDLHYFCVKQSEHK